MINIDSYDELNELKFKHYKHDFYEYSFGEKTDNDMCAIMWVGGMTEYPESLVFMFLYTGEWLLDTLNERLLKLKKIIK